MATATLPIHENPTMHKLEIHRTYNTDPVTIFQAWIKPEVMKEWFCPTNRTITNLSIDPRLGGAYRIEMSSPSTSPDQPAASVTGVYTAFEPGRLLAFTWNGTWAPGEESLVTLTMKPVDGKTEFHMTHDRFLSEPSRDGHNQGWTVHLDNLGKLYA